MDSQLFKNGNARFPISTDTLQFIQEQIFLVSRLAYLLGGSKDEYAVIKQPSTPSAMDGVCVFNGELLPLTGNPHEDGIEIVETKEDITANGITFAGARTKRYAVYTSGGNEYCDTFAFNTIENLLGKYNALARQHTLDKNALTALINDEAATRARHDLPKGSIIDWYGTCNCDNIPYGYVPCGCFFTGSSSSASLRTAEINKWKERYSSISILNDVTTDGSKFSIRISVCNGQTVPDLTDRFVVQAGKTYSLGNTGGSVSVVLEAKHIASHKHEYTKILTNDEGGTWLSQGNGVSNQVRRGSSYTGAGVYATDGTLATNAGNKGTAHENRPPYYALYKLIKVI